MKNLLREKSVKSTITRFRRKRELSVQAAPTIRTLYPKTSFTAIIRKILMKNDPSNINEDDVLDVVEEGQNVGVASEYKLRAEGPLGLRFVPETNQTGAYSLRSDNAPFERPDERPPRGSANDAPSVAPPDASRNDIYGIEEPTPLPNYAPENVRRNERLRSDEDKKQIEKSRKISQNDETVSLDDLYGRKRVERMENGDGERVAAKRRELPERPFWDDLLKPFASFGTTFRLGLVSAFAFIPCLLVTHFFTRSLADKAQTLLENQQQLYAITTFLSCVWSDRVIVFLYLLWGVFSTPYAFHIFTETANGADEFVEWPEYSFLGGLGQFLWVGVLIAIAGIPGAILFKFLHLSSAVGFAFSATLLTPIFFLSSMQTDALFTFLTKDVARSLKKAAKSWLCFYGVTYAFFFGSIALAVFDIWLAVNNYVKPNVGEKPHLQNVAFVALIFSIALSYIPALYARILGRLAWIIEDDARKQAEVEEDENGETSIV